MSAKKTLGQVYSEAMDDAKDMRGVVTWADRYAAGIAAVCRAVMAERDKSTEFALRAMQIPRVIAAARQAMEREPAKPVSPTSGTSNTGPILACDVKPEAASDAGDVTLDDVLNHECDQAEAKIEAEDWALRTWEGACKLFTGTGKFVNHECANIIREAAERHYAKQINMLKAVISAGKESSRIEHVKRLADRLDAMEKERDAAVAEVAKRPDERSCLAALMHISALLGMGGIVNPGDCVKAVEAMKAERDKALLSRCDHCGANTIDDCIRCGAPQCCPQCCKITTLSFEYDAASERIKKLESERDKIAAELAEVREAMLFCFSTDTCVGYSSASDEWCVYSGGKVLAKADDGFDAILAAYRATKGKEPTA